MGENPRRSAFRLRWGDSSDRESAEAPGSAEPSVDTAAGHPETAAEAPGAESTASSPAAAAAAEPAPEGAAVVETGVASDAATDSNPFMRELVDAMRQVAETSRDSSLAELRSTLDARIEEMRSAAADRAEDLRRRSDLDITGIGEWERTEIERVRGEAEQRRTARREQLEQQLSDHESATQASVEGARRKLADYERELSAFFADLSGIQDPAAFVSAAKRMPGPPDLASPAAAKAANGVAEAPAAEHSTPESLNGRPAADEEAKAGDTALAQRLAQLNARLGSSATEGPAQPAAEELKPEAAVPAASTPAATPVGTTSSAETSTPIVVKGLGSFGAITSFKQALERVDGVNGVTLSLGPTGEFVYRASHAAEFDIVDAIRQIEGPGAGIEKAEGSVQVTVGRQR